MRGFNWKGALDVAASVSVVVAAGFLVWLAMHKPTAATDVALKLPKEPVTLDGAQILGRRDAEFGIIEYSDFQCPFCARFEQSIFPQLRQAYIDTGRALFAFRELPLQAIHPLAEQAAEAAECAGRQGKFWEMHDRLFASASMLDQSSIQGTANALGLRPGEFAACLDREGPADVQRDASAAKALGVTGTPTFLIGRVDPDGRVLVSRILTGARPVSEFEAALSSAEAGPPGTR
jgi:protein-disulfide isomerase